MLTKTYVAALIGTVQATQYGNNHVEVRPDPPQVEASFPDPGVTLLSPAFQDNATVPADFANGTSGPTNDAVLKLFIAEMASRNEWMTYNPAEYLSEEGRTFDDVHLSNNSIAEDSKLRVWIQGAVHGNEPAADQAVLAFLGKLDANETWTQELLSKLDITVLPRSNPDGVAYFQRTYATNYDPNRDHTKLARQPTRAIKGTFNEFAPHVVADLHEYGATSLYGGLYRPGVDALFSAAKNLNIHPAIRNLSEEVFAPTIGDHLDAGGFRWEPYVTGSASSDPNSTIEYDEAGSDAKIGRNALGLTQSVTFLFETRGIGIADQELARRTATGLAMIEGILKAAVDNAESLRSTIVDSIEDFSNSTADIVVTDSNQEGVQRNWTFVEEESGEIVQVPVTFYSTTPTIANLTRARPEAYIIPRGWKDLAEMLEASGLEVEVLRNAFEGPVEALTIETSELASSYYEGTALATVTTSSEVKDIELPAGSFRVSTRQKNAALAFIALEPENIDSYVSFNIVPMDEADEYPVYRVLA